MKKLFFILLVVVVVAAAGVFAFTRTRQTDSPQTLAVADQQENSEPSEPAAISQTAYTPDVPKPSDPAGQNRYSNKQFKFSVLYPNELGATEYHEKNGALSVTFEDPTGEKGFQIYAQQYAGKQITDAQFKLDESSGVREQPTDVILDGTRATMFFGKNNAMGDTREVWMIHGGILYEIATYKDLDAWLGSIMKTWKFAD